MLSILSLNIAVQNVRILGRSFHRPLDHIEARLEKLISYLLGTDIDIVCFQELFHADYQHLVFSSVKSVFPYGTGFARKGMKFRLDNELLVLSKYPLTDGQLVRFQAAKPEERIFTSKGFYKVNLEIPEIGKLVLINAHMTAGGLRHHPEGEHSMNIRSKQIIQLLQHLPEEGPVIIVGDLNTGPEASRENYLQFIEAGLLDGFILAEGEGISWDPENPLVKNGTEHHLSPQRIDHILLNQAALKIFEPKNAEIVLTECSINAGINQIPVSDHYGVLIELHF